MSAPTGNKYNAIRPNDDEDVDNETPAEEKPIVPVAEIKPGEHRLQYTYCFWYSRRSPGKQATTQNYDQNLKLLAKFSSVEQFWGIYCHIQRPAELTTHSDIHIFRDGIKPMWEDPANKNGGKWIVRFRKGVSSRCWENLLMAMVGEQFMVGEEICGAVISVRFQEDIISVWNRTSQDTFTTTRIRDTLRRVLGVHHSTIMEYKTHNESLNEAEKRPQSSEMHSQSQSHSRSQSWSQSWSQSRALTRSKSQSQFQSRSQSQFQSQSQSQSESQSRSQSQSQSQSQWESQSRSQSQSQSQSSEKHSVIW